MAKVFVEIDVNSEALLMVREQCTFLGFEFEIRDEEAWPNVGIPLVKLCGEANLLRAYLVGAGYDVDGIEELEERHDYLVEEPGHENVVMRQITSWEAANMRMTFGRTVTRIE